MFVDLTSTESRAGQFPAAHVTLAGGAPWHYVNEEGELGGSQQGEHRGERDIYPTKTH
jgi:hypothetical protein